MNFIEKTIAKKVITNLTNNLPKIEQTILGKLPEISEKYSITEFENAVVLLTPLEDKNTGKKRLAVFLMVQEKNQPEGPIEYLSGPYTAENLLSILNDMDIENLPL